MLQPFDFHIQLRNHFKSQNKTWKWFSEVKVKNEQIEVFKTELLQNSYRLENSSETTVYQLLEKAKSKLGIQIPVTIYQSQNNGENNAGIIFIEKEAHLVISGNIMNLLSEDELLALIAHELSHILLYTFQDGDFEITSRIINAIGNVYRSDNSYNETARLYRLFTELFCDIGSLYVVENKDIVISTLIKIATGLSKISSENYLKQADEIIEKLDAGSTGDTHPESFLRAKSLALFAEKGSEAFPEISKLLIGKLGLYTLNIFSKNEVFELTKSLIQLIMKPKWMQCEHNKVLYQQYFGNYKMDTHAIFTEEFKDKINNCNNNLKEYFTYVLFDFALSDRDLIEPASGLVLEFAENLGIATFLNKAIKKELQLSDKQLNEFSQKATVALNKMMESEQEKIYE